MSDGDPRDDASSAASPFPAAYGSVGGSGAEPSTRAPGRRPLSERRPADGDGPSTSARLTGAIRKRRPVRFPRVGTTPSPSPPPPEGADGLAPEPPLKAVSRAGRRRAEADTAGSRASRRRAEADTAGSRASRRRAEADTAGSWERPPPAVTAVEGTLATSAAAPSAVASTVAAPTVAAPTVAAPRVVTAPPRRAPVPSPSDPAVPPPVDPAAPDAAPRLDRHERRTPDWMAQRVAESVVHDAPFEIGKSRRWRRRKVTVMRTRANRRMVRRIDTWTVFKVSIVFYLLMVIVVLVAGVVTWSVAQHLGFVGDIQKSVRSLADDKKFILHGNVALRYSAAGGAVLGLIGTLLNTVAAMLYNLLSDVIGGVQVVVVTEPD